LQAKLDKK